MFDDLFDNVEEDYTTFASTTNKYQKQPRTCAYQLQIPQKQRVAGTPVGLKNQGCTCYLNSLLQILFFTPQFRNVIYKIPLFKQTLEQPTGYLDQESKTKFVLGFQELFTQMQLLDCRSVGTTNLSDAFGWKEGQHAEQHDINQSMIVILETLERALKQTDFEGQIRDSFKILINKYIKCLNCHQIRNRDPEEVFQLLTYVKDRKCLDQGIRGLLIPQVVQGVECIHQGTKQNAEMGQTLHTLPQVLVITLGRFDFDYQTFQRIKLNSFFSFDLEMNMGEYIQNQGQKNYELYGVLIHSGSAHSGHYIAYVRDVMKQSDWDNSLKNLQEQQQKQKEAKQSKNQTKSQVNTKPQHKQQKKNQLKQPLNKELLQNWYQLNDSCVSPIQSSKIANQFEGGQSAYILFYRKINHAPTTLVPPPAYLKVKIDQKNQMAKQKRQFYNTQNQHIHLIINGQTYRTSINEKIGDLLEKYCPKGNSLVNKQQMNELPYYPIQLNYSQNLQDTISKADLVHESKWIILPLDSEQYLSIKDSIGIDKVPITLTILFQNQIHVLTTHTHKTLLQLRLLFQSKFNVSYQKQIIKLLNQYGKQTFLTDDITNDDLTLGKLNFKNLSQINLNYIKDDKNIQLTKQQKQNKVDNKPNNQKQNLGILSFAVQRDDSSGIRRYYVKQSMTLEQAFQYFKKAENIVDDFKRRIRWTNRNRLFSVDQYTKLLSQFPFQESIVKIKIERGQIPIKGDICVRVKNQSKYQQGEQDNTILEIMQDPNQTLKKLKQQICQKYKLDPAQHKMYRTDWLEQPTRPIVKQNQTLFESNFSLQQLIILRDIDSKLAAQLVHLNLYLTKTGFPDDCQKLLAFTTEQTKTLKEVKEDLMSVPALTQLLGQNPLFKRIRLRQLKRNYMFGVILRNNNKTLKGNGLQQFNVVVQILPNEQQLNEGDIVLATRYRDSVNRLYLDQTQFIFKASKTPTLKQLKEAFLSWKGFQLPQDQLRLFKYYLHDLQWVEWSDKLYQKWAQMRQKNSKSKIEQKNKQKQNSKKNKNENNKKKQGKKQQQSKAKVQQPPKTQQSQSTTNTQVKVSTENTQQPQQEDNTLPQIQTKKQQKPKTNQNQKKQRKQQQPKKGSKQQEGKQSQIQNLRKVPFLLKDGDIIGFGFNSEMLPGDDLQTQEDDNLRILQLNERKKMKGASHKHVKQNPFQFVLDF